MSFSGSLIPGRRPQSGLSSCVYTVPKINNSRELVLIMYVSDTRMGVVMGGGGGGGGGRFWDGRYVAWIKVTLL